MGDDLRRRAWRVMAWSALGALAVAAVGPLVGGSGMDYGKLWRGEGPDWGIFINLRVPRTLLAFLTGAALSTAGALYQALLRDALATPSSLGVTAAAALGAVAALALGPGDEAGFPVVWRTLRAAMQGKFNTDLVATLSIVTAAIIGQPPVFLRR